MLLAQDLNSIQTGAFPNATFGTNIGDFISKSGIMDYIFGAAAIALLIYLVLGGLQMMTSQGEPKTMQGAQAKITNALLGFVIIIVAFFIVQLVGNLLGLQGTLFGQVFGTK
jgi:hypothetical protein